jgi:hypothetical protein
VSFSGDGQKLATTSWKAIGVWDVATGRKVASIAPEPALERFTLRGFTHAQFDPTSGMVRGVEAQMLSTKNVLVKSWDAATYAHRTTVAVPGNAIAMSRNGRMLAFNGNKPGEI